MAMLILEQKYFSKLLKSLWKSTYLMEELDLVIKALGSAIPTRYQKHFKNPQRSNINSATRPIFTIFRSIVDGSYWHILPIGKARVKLSSTEEWRYHTSGTLQACRRRRISHWPWKDRTFVCKKQQENKKKIAWIPLSIGKKMESCTYEWMCVCCAASVWGLSLLYLSVFVNNVCLCLCLSERVCNKLCMLIAYIRLVCINYFSIPPPD